MDHSKTKLIFENWNKYLSYQKNIQKQEDNFENLLNECYSFLDQVNEETFKETGIKPFTGEITLTEGVDAIVAKGAKYAEPAGKLFRQALGAVTGASQKAKTGLSNMAQRLRSGGVPTSNVPPAAPAGPSKAFQDLIDKGKNLASDSGKLTTAQRMANTTATLRASDAAVAVRNAEKALEAMMKPGQTAQSMRATKAAYEAAAREAQTAKAVADQAARNAEKAMGAAGKAPTGSLERLKTLQARDAARTGQTLTKVGEDAAAAAEKLGQGSKAASPLNVALKGAGILATGYAIYDIVSGFTDEDNNAIVTYRQDVENLANAQDEKDAQAAVDALKKSAPAARRVTRKAARATRRASREGGMRISGAKKLQAAGFGTGLDPRENFMAIYDDFYSSLSKQGKADILRYRGTDGRDYKFGPKHRKALAAIGGKKPAAAATGEKNKLPSFKMPKIAGTDEEGGTLAQQYMRSQGTITGATPVPERILRTVAMGRYLSPVLIDKLDQRGIDTEDILTQAQQYHSDNNFPGKAPSTIRTQR